MLFFFPPIKMKIKKSEEAEGSLFEEIQNLKR